MDFKTFCFYSCQSYRQARGADKPSWKSDCSFRKRNEDEPEREYYDKDINAPLAFKFFDRKKGQ